MKKMAFVPCFEEIAIKLNETCVKISTKGNSWKIQNKEKNNQTNLNGLDATFDESIPCLAPKTSQAKHTYPKYYLDPK